MCEMFGYRSEELIARTFQELTYTDDLELGAELLQDLIAGRRDYGWLEKRYVRKDGKIIWTLLSTSVVRSADGQPQYMVSQIQNITERKEAEAKLAEKESQYRSIFEASQDGLLVLQLDGAIVDVSPAFCKLHGYGCGELIGRHAALLIHPDDHPVFDEYLQTVRRGEVFLGRVVDLHKNGTSFHVEVHGAPFSYRGEPHALAVFRDVTMQMQLQSILEEEVAARTRELAALYDVTSVASASLELKTVIEQSLERVLEVMDCRIGGIHLVNPDTGEMNLVAWRNIPTEILAEIGTLPADGGIAGRILKHGASLIVPSMMDDPDAVPAARQLLSRHRYVGAPMRSKGRAIGVMSIVGPEGRAFKTEEVNLLASIATQIGVAAENARLYEQVEVLAVAEERQRIARDIHDTLAQGFTGIKLQLDAVESALERDESASAYQRLHVARQLADQSLAEARRSVWALRSKSLEDRRIGDALLDSLRGLTAGTDLEVSVDLQDDLPEFPAELKSELLLVSQEAITNVVRHAQAQHLSIRLTHADSQAQLRICDDGRGISPNRYGEGLGEWWVWPDHHATAHGATWRHAADPYSSPARHMHHRHGGFRRRRSVTG